MAEKVTTVFIEDTGIRLLIAKGRQVVRWASAPLEPGLVSGSVILDEPRVADKLKELFQRAEVSGGKVIAGLSGLNSLYRLITLPVLPKAILPEAVRREAGRVIPASLDEVYLSYQTIPAPSGETRALLAAYSRKETDVLVSTLRRAGLKPTMLDLSPLSLCRTLNKPKAIIASVRSGCLDIIVMVNGIPQVIRNLPLHGETTLSSENMTAIAEELERTVSFYNSSHAEEPLDSTVPVFVSGDLAEAHDHWQSLVGAQKYPVSVLPSPMEHPKGFPANEFMVNIGLALKKVALEKEGAYYSLVNLNALPDIYRPERVSGSRIADPIAAAVGLGILALLYFIGNSTAAQISALSTQVADVESRTGKAVEEAATLKREISQAEAGIKPLADTKDVLLAKLTGLKEEREQAHGDSVEIVKLNGTVLLNTTDYSDGSATIKGTAQSVADIFSYARALRSGGRFSEVIITSLSHIDPKVDGATEVVLLPYSPPAYIKIVEEVGKAAGRSEVTQIVETQGAKWVFQILLK